MGSESPVKVLTTSSRSSDIAYRAIINIMAVRTWIKKASFRSDCMRRVLFYSTEC